MKLSKAEISKIIQTGGFLGWLLCKLAGPLMKVAIILGKNVLALIEITAAPLAIGPRIQKKIHVSGTTTLITPNKEINDMIKIVQALEDSRVLLKGVTKQLKPKQKNKKEDF